MFVRTIACFCLGLSLLGAAEPGAGRIRRDVYKLASDKMKGRLAGTPELDQAADFIAQRMWHLGLQPGTAGGWFQTVPAHASVAQNISVTVTAGEKKFSLNGENARAIAVRNLDLSDSAVVKITAESARASKPEDFSGKVLLTTESVRGLRLGTPALVIVASSAVARGWSMQPSIMSVPRLGSRPAPYPVLVAGDEELGKWVQGLAPGDVAGSKAAGQIKAEERDIDLKNVVGVLPGSDPQLRNEYVIVSAHYDHIGELPTGADRIRNGANDDASGVATMLAVAKLLSQGKTKPKRSTVFIAWTGEEEGGLGSQFYANNPLFPLSKTAAMINLEQTGRYDGEGGAGKGRALVTGYGYSDLGKILTDAAKPAKFEIYAGPDEFFTRSDNVFLAEFGVPAHTVAASLEFPDYHGVADSAEKLDYDNMAVLSKAIAAGVLAISNAPLGPKWNESLDVTKPFRKARAANGTS